MPPDFLIGDVVQLKSGGPAMTVESVGDYSGVSAGPEDGVYCVWFQNGKKSASVFDAAMLRKTE